MKRVFIFTCAIALIAAALAGCSGKQELYVYNWSDYINEDLVVQFEKEHNCRIVMDYFDSNETMFAKLKAGATGYDVVFPSGYMVQIMAREGLLESLDRTKLPNLANIDPKYVGFSLDEHFEYSVPYMISNTGLGYLASRVDGDFEPSWFVFGDSRYAGRMTMLNDMREAIGAALKSLGYSINTVNPAELEEAKDLLIRWKRNLAKFEADQYKNGLVSEEFFIVQGYSGDLYQTMEENEDIVYAIPKEGTSLACDNIVILKTSEHKDLAYAFLNFLLDGEVAAANMEYVYYLAPNTAAYPFLSDELKAEEPILMPDSIIANCEVIQDLGEGNALYSAVWDEVKAAK